MTSRSLLPALLLLLAPLARAQLELEGGWIRLPPPGARTAAGYATLVNPGEDALRIEAVSCRRFETSMLHETVLEDGVSRMRHLDGVDIGPGERFAFVPGGPHLMFMRPATPLAEGERIVVTLEFADGSSQALELPVRRD